MLFFCFFFTDTATTEIYTLSLHDALPISPTASERTGPRSAATRASTASPSSVSWTITTRSEEHTSELQSRVDLVCRLLLEKKKKDHRNETRPRDDAAGSTHSVRRREGRDK